MFEEGGVWNIKTSTTLKTMELKFKVTLHSAYIVFYFYYGVVTNTMLNETIKVKVNLITAMVILINQT